MSFITIVTRCVCFLKQNLIDSISIYQDKHQTTTQAYGQFSTQFYSYLKNSLNVLQRAANNAANQSRNTSNSFMWNTFGADDISNDTLLGIIDDTALDTSNLVVKMNVMCILYHHLFGNLDQKLFAAVIESNTKVCYLSNRILCNRILCNRANEVIEVYQYLRNNHRRTIFIL